MSTRIGSPGGSDFPRNSNPTEGRSSSVILIPHFRRLGSSTSNPHKETPFILRSVIVELNRVRSEPEDDSPIRVSVPVTLAAKVVKLIPMAPAIAWLEVSFLPDISLLSLLYAGVRRGFLTSASACLSVESTSTPTWYCSYAVHFVGRVQSNTSFVNSTSLFPYWLRSLQEGSVLKPDMSN